MAVDYRLSYDIADKNLPYLMITPDNSGKEAPLVILLHGSGGRKESQLPRLYSFAQAGFRAVAIDLSLHGERRLSPHEESAEPSILTLIQIVQETIGDVSRLLDHLKVNRAAIHGISLGGIIVFAALVQDPRLAVATVSLGNPDWVGLVEQMGLSAGHPIFDQVAARSPLEHAARSYAPRPLLMQHGDADTLVPVGGVQELYERCLPSYTAAGYPDRLQLDITPGLGHEMTDAMFQRCVAWTREYAGELG